MIKASDLCEQCRIPLDEKWGYIYGQAGAVWTEAKQKAATRTQTVKWGARWIGKRVTDCSGLLAWAFKELGGSIYHGSNTMYHKYTTARGKITPGMVLMPGTAVFLYDGSTRHHVGLYVGNDTVIEAKGTYYGVVTSNVSHWDEWGTLTGVDYEDAEGEIVQAAHPTIRQGAVGTSVAAMQQLLGQHGYAIVQDGVFGPETLSALTNFQRAAGLDADGVCGPLTWAALQKEQPQEEPTEGDQESEEKPQPAWQELVQQLRDALADSRELNTRMGQMIEALNIYLEEDVKNDVG